MNQLVMNDSPLRLPHRIRPEALEEARLPPHHRQRVLQIRRVLLKRFAPQTLSPIVMWKRVLDRKSERQALIDVYNARYCTSSQNRCSIAATSALVARPVGSKMLPGLPPIMPAFCIAATAFLA